MEAIELKKDQIERNGKLLIPKLKDHNSLYFHPLTKIYDSILYRGWGLQLTNICKRTNTQYYFVKIGNRKIHIYPNSIIEKWFQENEPKILNAKKKPLPPTLSKKQLNEILALNKKK